MANSKRTAQTLNAILHGINSSDYHPSDQAGLQEVLMDYFDDNKTCSDSTDDSETSEDDNEELHDNVHDIESNENRASIR